MPARSNRYEPLPEHEPVFIRPELAARIMDVSQQAVRRWCENGDFVAKRVRNTGACWRIRTRYFLELLGIRWYDVRKMMDGID